MGKLPKDWRSTMHIYVRIRFHTRAYTTHLISSSEVWFIHLTPNILWPCPYRSLQVNSCPSTSSNQVINCSDFLLLVNEEIILAITANKVLKKSWLMTRVSRLYLRTQCWWIANGSECGTCWCEGVHSKLMEATWWLFYREVISSFLLMTPSWAL